MDDQEAMQAAMALAASVRTRTSPNPWVGAVVLDEHRRLVGSGATEPPGGRHAEVGALAEAGGRAHGGTLAVTLEPCSHHGRTPPCTDAVLAAGVRRVVVGTLDPDPRVAGRGVARLRDAGLDVEVGVLEHEITRQLTPYLHHRRTARPYVVCKLAATLDGATAAPDGTSKWITGEAARTDAHLLRAESDAILVGAGTVRTDDPSLTVRLVEGPDPIRVVLGHAPPQARIHPCIQWTPDDGDLLALLEHLGTVGVLQLMVEGGATVVRSFHDAGLIDRYVVYLAPAIVGGSEARPLIAGPSVPTIDEFWRGRIAAVRSIGDDVRIDLVPLPSSPTPQFDPEEV